MYSSSSFWLSEQQTLNIEHYRVSLHVRLIIPLFELTKKRLSLSLRNTSLSRIDWDAVTSNECGKDDGQNCEDCNDNDYIGLISNGSDEKEDHKDGKGCWHTKVLLVEAIEPDRKEDEYDNESQDQFGLVSG